LINRTDIEVDRKELSIDPNKDYIVFEKDIYDEIEKCNKQLVGNSFLTGLFIGLIIGIVFTLLLN